MTTKNATWSKAQVRQMVNEIEEDLRRSMPYTTDKVRQAMVDSDVLRTIRHQGTGSVSVASIEELRNAMVAEINRRMPWCLPDYEGHEPQAGRTADNEEYDLRGSAPLTEEEE